MAAAASDSLDQAVADSLRPAHGFAVMQAGAPVAALSACDDKVDASDWQLVGSHLLELQVPPGFAGATQSDQSAQWMGPVGSIRIFGSNATNPHAGIYGTITSECDVFVSGAETHVDLVSSAYGGTVHALIHPQNAPAIGFEAQSRTVAGQAQLLHSLRSARISAAWGRS